MKMPSGMYEDEIAECACSLPRTGSMRYEYNVVDGIRVECECGRVGPWARSMKEALLRWNESLRSTPPGGAK